MTRMQLLGIGLVGVGAFLLFLSDDSDYFAAIVEVEDCEDGPTLKLAMKTRLGDATNNTSSCPGRELPPSLQED